MPICRTVFYDDDFDVAEYPRVDRQLLNRQDVCFANQRVDCNIKKSITAYIFFTSKEIIYKYMHIHIM